MSEITINDAQLRVLLNEKAAAEARVDELLRALGDRQKIDNLERMLRTTLCRNPVAYDALKTAAVAEGYADVSEMKEWLERVGEVVQRNAQRTVGGRSDAHV